mmetsp:Transcript_2789/g.6638  ORF Transcript_2789/g.6638 Transcript_2789/m.6638 type:complete len:325 (-) Transcript_2789:2404-3378(-)
MAVGVADASQLTKLILNLLTAHSLCLLACAVEGKRGQRQEVRKCQNRATVWQAQVRLVELQHPLPELMLIQGPDALRVEDHVRIRAAPLVELRIVPGEERNHIDILRNCRGKHLDAHVVAGLDQGQQLRHGVGEPRGAHLAGVQCEVPVPGHEEDPAVLGLQHLQGAQRGVHRLRHVSGHDQYVVLELCIVNGLAPLCIGFVVVVEVRNHPDLGKSAGPAPVSKQLALLGSRSPLGNGSKAGLQALPGHRVVAVHGQRPGKLSIGLLDLARAQQCHSQAATSFSRALLQLRSNAGILHRLTPELHMAQRSRAIAVQSRQSGRAL